MSNKPGWVGSKPPRHSSSSGGRIGTRSRTIYTKDAMGFNLEVMKRCQAHEGKSQDTVWRHRKKDREARDELSGETAKKAKAEVTVPKFSWDK